jgi:hypothetical protein
MVGNGSPTRRHHVQTEGDGANSSQDRIMRMVSSVDFDAMSGPPQQRPTA